MKSLCIAAAFLLVAQTAVAHPVVLPLERLEKAMQDTQKNTLTKLYDSPYRTGFMVKIHTFVAPHKHLYHDEFFAVQKGSGTLLIKKDSQVNRHKVSAGTVFFIPKGVEHAYIPDKDPTLGISVFSPQWKKMDREQVEWPKGSF